MCMYMRLGQSKDEYITHICKYEYFYGVCHLLKVQHAVHVDVRRVLIRCVVPSGSDVKFHSACRWPHCRGLRGRPLP